MLKPIKQLAHKTLIIGHRGASGYAPENTLSSFEEALKMKADMIELDIQLTSDREWVVIHDLTLKRTCGLSKKVLSTSLSIIKTLDAGSWFSSRFAGETVLTLDELLAWAHERVNLNIEIKGKFQKRSQSIPVLLKKISTYKMQNHVILSSFDWKFLREIRQHNKTIPIGVLVNRQYRFLYLREALDLKAFSIHLPKNKMKKELGEKIHHHQIKVYLYTLNTLKDMEKYLKMGIDGFFTNYPDQPRGNLVEEAT